MGQTETIIVLKKEKDWISANEIAQILRVENVNQIRRALKKMYNHNEIFRKEIKKEEGTRVFLYKER